ncbi:cohesin subunit SA-2-like [Spea bombifrons]|uniref:cohesin subunit SA-2-like n=1 Tax=Spea bombifrons TaxID=233779 RepID=UPI0023494FD3|nr:cohesin subunit SA-2-like [Spea bombifrons]
MIAVSNQTTDVGQKENAHTNCLLDATNQNGDLGILMTPKPKRIRKPSENLSRRSSARRSRDSQITNGDVPEAVTLFEVVSIGKRAIQSVVDDWIEAYQEDRDAALLDLINFYIQCSGCQGVVTAELFQNPHNQEIMKKLTEEFDEETGLQFKKFMAYPWILTITWPVYMNAEDYPLIKPGIQWRKFKANFCEFTAVLVQQCQYSVIYDGYLLDTIISLLLGLADSHVRAFRHTSTLTAVKLLTALIRVVLNVDIGIDNSHRLLKLEKKRLVMKRTNSRFEQLDKKRKELQQKHQEIENMMDALFKGTFIQRYRDVVPEIRAACIEELGVWMKMYPQKYLNDSCLKYVGWMLYDKIPEVRLKSVMALQVLYEKKDLVSKMDLFTSRFKDRIVSMTLDRDHDVSVQAMKLLVCISQDCEDVFTSEDCEILYQFVYAAHRPLAAAAGEFLYRRCLNQVARQEIPLQRTEGIGHRSGQLRTLLAFFSKSELHNHLIYLVDSLWDCTPGFLKDWQCMSTILLQEGTGEDEALSSTQESLLIELIVTSARQAVEGHPSVGRGAAKRVLSAKEKRLQLEDSVRITEHFSRTLPLLLAKFSSDPDKVTNLLHILQYFDMEVYSAECMDRHLEALLKQIKMVVESHSVPEVLEACSKAYRSLSKENLACHIRVSLSMRQLVEQLVDNFSQMLDKILQEREESLAMGDMQPMVNTLRRLAAFHNAHNLTQWDLCQKMSLLLSFDTEQHSLPVQIIVPALQCMYYALLWKLVPIMEESHTKEVIVSFKAQVARFYQICRHYLNHQDRSLREQAFMSLCDLLLLLRHRSGEVSSCTDSTLQSQLLEFIQGHVFSVEEPKNKGETLNDDDAVLASLHRRRSLLAVYCKLIAYNAVEMAAASEIYKQYMKTYNDFGDIIKETLSRTRQNNRIESAKTLVLCLQQLFQEHKEKHGNAIQSSASFTNIKELARRFSLTFGMDHVKCRESIAMMHKQGIEFAFREPAAEDTLPPPNMPFLIVISEFSSKLLKADKRLVYGYLQRFANEQMLLCRGAEWHPLVVYNNSLLDNQDEESSINGSSFSRDLGFSSTSQYLKRKLSCGSGVGESHALGAPCPVKSRRQLVLEDQTIQESGSLGSRKSSKQIQQNIGEDEDNVDVDVDMEEKNQETAGTTKSEYQDISL